METFVDVKDYEGMYQVSNEGRVKALSRIVERKDGKICVMKERILLPYLNDFGKARVGLYRNGKAKLIMLDTLVKNHFGDDVNNG